MPSSRMVNVSLVDHSSGNVSMPSEHSSVLKKPPKSCPRPLFSPLLQQNSSRLAYFCGLHFLTSHLFHTHSNKASAINTPLKQCHHFYTKNHLSKYTISIQNQN
ncbi:unnamed protein product [Rangifer tarandus platyrhynchus]|uniref:Uncharacterized protein n=1 Tax=Rangifer tarandus platyrhynchus TaxID=3082113 RepID=A0AC59YKG5_RANTA